jgi:hypothetical protein
MEQRQLVFWRGVDFIFVNNLLFLFIIQIALFINRQLKTNPILYHFSQRMSLGWQQACFKRDSPWID